MPFQLLAALPYLGTAAAGLFSGWAGQKIANKGQGKPTINQRMKSLGNNSDIPGIRGNTGPEGGPLQFPLYSPEQMAQQSQLGQMGMEGLKNNPFDFGPIKSATMNDYYSHLMPQLLERFAGLGGNQNSSGLLNSLSESGESLQTKLAAMEQDYRSQAGDRYLKMFNQGNQPQYENMILSPQPSTGRAAFNKALEYGVPALATFGGAYMGYKGNQQLANSLQANRAAAAPIK